MSTSTHTLTLVSAFYVLEQAKFPKETYIQWLGNLINIVRMNPYVLLVLYTDTYSKQWLPLWLHTMPTIRIMIRELTEFYMYKYAAHWRRNHEANHLLRMTTNWELNMLWSEKVWFLKGAIDATPLNQQTPYYAWCDAGYFRDRSPREDLCTGGGLNYLQWATPKRMQQLDPSKIYYSLINTNPIALGNLRHIILNKDPATRLPRAAIPAKQVSIGGGFCLLAPHLIGDWCEEYTYKLEDYFNGERLVKDDQIILADCIFSDTSASGRFFLVNEGATTYDPWFVFQRFLM